MFLSKKYCFADESEARSNFSGLLSQVSADDMRLFDRVLSTVFSVRQALFDFVHRTGAAKKGSAETGLPDMCITAVEEYVIPALSAQGIGSCMELRQYNFDEVPAGLPRIHAFVLITLHNCELIIDVDADPFYDEDIGVVIAPNKTGLYSLGLPVHRRLITESGHIDKFECYTRESRTYLTCEGSAYVTVRNYFFESDSNLCPIVLSPYSTAYFSYSAGWIGTLRRDWIKLILVAHSQEKNLLLWNLTFDDVSSIELRFAEVKKLRLVFLDNTDMLIPLDRYGYPRESETVQYVTQGPQTQDVVKYAFHSSPTGRISLPSPFDGDEILSKQKSGEKGKPQSI